MDGFVTPAIGGAQDILELGLAAERAGDLAAAEARYRQALEASPEDPAASRQLGRLLLRRREPHEAFGHLLVVMRALPQEASSWLDIQEALVGARMFEAARGLVTQAEALGLDAVAVSTMRRMLIDSATEKLSAPAPSAPRGSGEAAPRRPQPAARRVGPAEHKALRLLERGDRAAMAGRDKEAEAEYRAAVTAWPGCGGAWNHLGNLLHKQQRIAEAEQTYRAGLSAEPDSARLHQNLGVVLYSQARVEEAEAMFRRALELEPDFSGAALSLATSLTQRGLYEEVEATFRRLLSHRAGDAAVLTAFGDFLARQDRLGEAEAAFRKALAGKPREHGIAVRLGDLLLRQTRLAEAETVFRKVVGHHPDALDAVIGLGKSLMAQGKVADAEAVLRKALRSHPKAEVLRQELSSVFFRDDRAHEAADILREAIALDPKSFAARASLLFILPHTTASEEELFQEHVGAGAAMEAAVTPAVHVARGQDAARRPRLGFVSGDFRRHAVAHFFMPVWQGLRERGFELFAYHNSEHVDDISRRFRQEATGWRHIHGVDDETVSEMILKDGIDILVDLSGYTLYTRLPLFARRPAPVQVSYVGYPATTGLKRMDYLLIGANIAPPGFMDAQFTEKLVRLPQLLMFDWSVNAVMPEVNALPALSNGHVTFGSFNRPAKAGDDVIELWSRVLKAVPQSRFLVGAMTSQKLADRTAERFERFGIERERLIFRPHSQYYLSFHNEVDLLLDTFPYAGGTTTALALGMGVPTLTLAGSSFASRVGMCFLQDVGLPEFVAHTPEDYVGKAVEWSRRLPELAGIRAGLRERAEGRLKDSERAIRGFDAAFMTMWRRWCMGLAAESFEVKLDE